MKKLLVVLFLSLIFRILLIPVARHGDINNNTSWGDAMLDKGPVDYYEVKPSGGWKYSAPNQPPLYIYLFTTTSFMNRTGYSLMLSLNKGISLFPSSLVWWWEQWGELYTAKVPGILADLLIAIFIYKYFEKSKRLALSLSSLWLLNPISWYNSGIWGGTDSVVNLLGLASIFFLLKKKNLKISVLFFTLSLLFKGSLTLFAPILIFIAIKQHYALKTWVTSALLSVALILLICLPIYPHLDIVLYLYKLYTLRFFPGEIGSLTANAFNFWWLIDPGKTLDSTVFLFLPAKIWGYLVFASLYVFTLYKLSKGKDKNSFLLGLTLIPLSSFLFLTRIHERYLYPFFPLATICVGYFSWMIVPYIFLSLINLLNLYHLFWAPGIEFVKEWYLNPYFMSGLSVFSLILFLYILIKAQKSL